MKVSPGFRVLGLLVLGLCAAAPKTQAQGVGISVTGSADNVAVNTPVTYTILVTNLTFTTFSDARVTNTLPSSAVITGTTTTYGIANVNGSVVWFDLGPLPSGQTGLPFAQMTVTAQLTAAGSVIDSVTVSDAPTGSQGAASATTTVTNVAPTVADLAVSLAGPAQAVITNDFVTYGITVSNLGPNDAPNVKLTNSLAGMKFLTNSPGNLSRTFISSNVVFNLGTLTNGAVTSISVRVQPTNAGPLTLTASVGSTNIIEANPTNNIAATNITVGTYLPGVLTVALVNPSQQFNPQDGFMEQAIRLSNVGTNPVASARVIISGLTKTNWLFNAAGTNNGNPFVVYATTLDTNQSVDLLLQFFVATGQTFPFTTNQLKEFEIPLYDLTPPPGIGTPVNVSRKLQLASGGILLEFDSLTNRTYTIAYSDDMSFSNALVAIPSVTSSKVNRLQWVDYGPPATISHPTNVPARYYWVLLAP